MSCALDVWLISSLPSSFSQRWMDRQTHFSLWNSITRRENILLSLVFIVPLKNRTSCWWFSLGSYHGESLTFGGYVTGRKSLMGSFKDFFWDSLKVCWTFEWLFWLFVTFWGVLRILWDSWCHGSLNFDGSPQRLPWDSVGILEDLMNHRH